MKNVKEFGEIVFELVGGMLGVMSGGVSVVCAVLGLIFTGNDKVPWGFLSYVALFVCLFISIKKNWPALKIHAPPIEIKADDQNHITFEVRNFSRNQNAQNVRVRLMAFEDNAPREKTRPVVPLELSPFFLAHAPISIQPGGEEHFELCSGITYGMSHYPQGEHGVMTDFQGVTCFWELNKDYPIRIRVTADDFPPTERTVRLNFKYQDGKCNFTLA